MEDSVRTVEAVAAKIKERLTNIQKSSQRTFRCTFFLAVAAMAALGYLDVVVPNLRIVAPFTLAAILGVWLLLRFSTDSAHLERCMGSLDVLETRYRGRQLKEAQYKLFEEGCTRILDEAVAGLTRPFALRLGGDTPFTDFLGTIKTIAHEIVVRQRDENGDDKVAEAEPEKPKRVPKR